MILRPIIKIEIECCIMEYYYQRRDQRNILHDYRKFVLVPCYRKDKYETFGYTVATDPWIYNKTEMEMEMIYTEEI